jgi:hypothetical protein
VSKLGKKDLFSSTLRRPVQPGSRRLVPGEDGDVEKVMVMLSARQVHALDKICLEIRQTTGIKVKRSMLIRSIIDGFWKQHPITMPPKVRPTSSASFLKPCIHGSCPSRSTANCPSCRPQQDRVERIAGSPKRRIFP